MLINNNKLWLIADTIIGCILYWLHSMLMFILTLRFSTTFYYTHTSMWLNIYINILWCVVIFFISHFQFTRFGRSCASMCEWAHELEFVEYNPIYYIYIWCVIMIRIGTNLEWGSFSARKWRTNHFILQCNTMQGTGTPTRPHCILYIWESDRKRTRREIISNEWTSNFRKLYIR